MLSARNFNPFVVETISPRNVRKPCEINEFKLNLRGEGERRGSNNEAEDGDGQRRVGRENT